MASTIRLIRFAVPAAVAPLAAALLLLSSDAARAQQAPAMNHGCGPVGETKGDYISDRRRLKIVEDYHFTPQVEALIRGQSGVKIGGDLDYTLLSFPNHHRALMAMMRLAERERTPRPDGSSLTVECYFDRALRFRPDDAVARMLYATYLFKNRRADEAKAQLERTAADAGDAPLTHYNLGLIYLEMKHYDAALKHAHKAHALGLQRPGLREQLTLANRWQEPPAVESGAEGAAPAASAASATAPAASSSN